MALKVRKNRRARQEALWAYLMIAPMLLGFGIFFYLALGASFFISFSQWDILTPPKWVGFENYRNLLADPSFRRALWNTTYYTLLSVPLGLLVSLLLAIALNTNLRFRNLYRLIFFLPVLTMPVAIGIVWNWIYNPDFGILNQFLGVFGAPRLKWLTDPKLAMPALVILSVWQGSGYGMIIFLAGLQNIPKEYYEAAQIDGAKGWQRFRFITLPLLSPTVFFVTVTSLIGAFQVFDVVYAMTAGRASNTLRTVVYQIYDEGFRYFRMGHATAIAWLLFALILLITVIQFNFQRRWVHYE
jgi:multiple sugar transport system permease protein